MAKYIVIKKLELAFECTANSAKEAEAACIEASEIEDMTIIDCQYEVTREQHQDTTSTVLGLENKYGTWTNGHPDFTRTSWKEEVSRGSTICGYYAWVHAQIEEYNHADDDE